MHSLIITAAGSSQRMGFDKLKEFIGKTRVLTQTLNCFSPELFSPILITVSSSELNFWQEELKEYSVSITPGGATRQESILLGLQALAQHQPRWVWIHDGARPNVSPQLITRIKERLESNPKEGVLPVLPITDTVKRVSQSGLCITTIDRNSLRLAQTPQAFSYPIMYELAHKAYQNQVSVTDDASIYEYFDHPVATVAGDNRNIKITVPMDLELIKQGLPT